MAETAQTGQHGLTAAEVAERVRLGQVNRTRRSDWAEYRDIVARNVLTLFNAIVVPAAVALFWLGDPRGAVGVSGFAAINTLMGSGCVVVDGNVDAFGDLEVARVLL